MVSGVIGGKQHENEEYKKLSIAEFTKAAGRYESNHAGIYEMCKKDYPDILEELKKEPFRDLLDAGCGPAPMISLLAEKYPDRHYTGLDLTPAMIEQAKKKNISNATFVVGDCENFPFENDSFDAIICSMSFHHYPDPQAFFDSVKRCLRPNGRLILRDVTSDNKVLVWLMNTLDVYKRQAYHRNIFRKMRNYLRKKICSHMHFPVVISQENLWRTWCMRHREILF